MKSGDILIFLGSLTLVLLLWATVGARYLKDLKGEIEKSWVDLLNKLNERADLAVVLIEILRRNSYKNEGLKEIEKLRNESLKINSAGDEKTEIEVRFSAVIKRVVLDAESYVNTKKDPHFWQIRQDLQKIEQNIESEANNFNKKVDRFNESILLSALFPIVKILKYKPKASFEFEA